MNTCLSSLWQIDEVPDGAVKPSNIKFPIFFFGTHETLVIARNLLLLFEGDWYKHRLQTGRSEVEFQADHKMCGLGQDTKTPRSAIVYNIFPKVIKKQSLINKGFKYLKFVFIYGGESVGTIEDEQNIHITRKPFCLLSSVFAAPCFYEYKVLN